MRFSWATDRLSSRPPGRLRSTIGTQTVRREPHRVPGPLLRDRARRPHSPGPCRTLPPEAGLRRPLPERRPEAGMLSGSGRPRLRGSAASSRCARPSASAPAPPTLVCSRPRPCGSTGARSRLQRGGSTESPAGEDCTRPGQSGALGAGCPGQVGAARGTREGAGPRQRTGARRDGRRVGVGAGRSRCSAGRPQTWKKLSLEALFPRGAVVVPSSPGPCRVGLTSHRPQLHLRPGLHFCGRCRGGEGWRGGGREHHIWGG